MAQRVNVQDLAAGQVLARDLLGREGDLLASRGTVVTRGLIDRIAEHGLDAVWVEEPGETEGGAGAGEPARTPKATRPVNGSFRFLQKRNALLLTVTLPKGGGEAVTLEQVKEDLGRQNLTRIDWKQCERAVKEARGVPVDISGRDGIFSLELDGEGLFLTVVPPLPKGDKVNPFHVRREIESKHYNLIDERQIQRLVAAATGRREKIGEVSGAARVQVSGDRLAAEIVVTGPNGGAPVDVQAANRALAEAGVTHGILPGEVESAIRPESWGKTVVVARGSAPTEGTEGRLVERHGESKELQSLEGSLKCKILEPSGIVEKGDVLVERAPSVEGKDGVDVRGEPLPRRKVPNPELPRPGANVERSEDGLRLTATARGLPSARGPTLSVEPLQSVRVEAATLEEALEAGRRILGLEEAGHEVEQAGHKGILGLGAAPFRVRVFPETKEAAKAPDAAPPAPVEKAPVPMKALEATEEIAPDANKMKDAAVSASNEAAERRPDEAVGGRDQATKPVDGSFRVIQKKGSISITVAPPKGGGEAVTLEQVKEDLGRQNLTRIDWKPCERAVKEARGIPVDISARDGIFSLELDGEGLFLTVVPPLPKGDKVNPFHVRREIESKHYNLIDERQIQRLVAAATGRREKIGEVSGAARVQVSGDRLAAEMTVVGPNGGEPADGEAANRALAEAGVTHGILPGEVESAIRPESWGKAVVVARGSAPTEGTEGRLVERQGESKAFQSLEGSLKCKILEPSGIVEKGDVLVERVPSVEGKDGVDVRGKPLPRRKVPNPELPRPGANVERSEDGLRLTATARGLPSARGPTLSVEPLQSVRVEAATLEEALEAGRRILGLEEAGHEVEQAGHKGILGLGAAPFCVRVFREAQGAGKAPEVAQPGSAKRSPVPVKVLEATDERPPKTDEIASDLNNRREIRLHADPERLHVYLTVRQKSDAAVVPPEEVHALLGKAGIALPEEGSPGVEEFLAALGKEPMEVKWKLLASGRPPQAGRDAPVTWAIDLVEDRPEEGERADYYEVTKFANVAAGDALFTLGDPEAGVDGVDIYGNPIPAPPGRAVPIKAGENARYSPDGKSCAAVTGGAVQVKKEVVSVHQLYRVRGDVDFHVGNVDFNGVVEVSGNILDDFKVRAAQDLFVGGNIDAAEIEVGRNLRIRQGITGHEKGRVRVRGNVDVKYVNGATLIAEGDVIVHVQIMNSTVLSRGKIVVERGGIVGGVTAGLLGVRSPVLGSEMGVKTQVTAGVDLAGSALVEEIEKTLREMDETIVRIESAVLPYVQQPEILEQLPEDKRDAARKLIFRLEAMKARRQALAEERDRLSAPPAFQIRPAIAVSKRVYHNVDIRVGPMCRMLVHQELSGPIKLRANEENDTVESYRG